MHGSFCPRFEDEINKCTAAENVCWAQEGEESGTMRTLAPFLGMDAPGGRAEPTSLGPCDAMLCGLFTSFLAFLGNEVFDEGSCSKYVTGGDDIL